ncbi:MAG: aminotransferase class V-fold PLP-dependent enzyme [Bacteroidota bacterium]|nr:aminotransferase class V-fold PLP-dependent enzyme [Rhodothermia bacterium]MDW8285455.1 aminotransferase class V-fold PLP-dependent enzyme [Bacteroidota bacterium]
MLSRRQFLGRTVGWTGLAVAALREDGLARILEASGGLDPHRSPEEVARDEDFWAEVQQAFAVDRTLINLNNGGVCPSPRMVHEALKQYLDYSNLAPVLHMWRHLEPRIESVRAALARHFGCDPEELAITRNASEALEIAQLGVDLKPGDEVITTTQDYPRMLTTWDQRARRDRIAVRKITFPVPLLEPQEFVRRIEAAITPRTRILHICHVINITGQILPVREVCRLAHQYGLEVIVDGAHAFAHFPFTVADLDCDYYGTSLHKWLCAPIGTGFLYVRREKIPRLWPLMGAPADMTANIRKFEEIGTHPAAPHNAIAEALAFHEAIGVERKAARLRYLNRRWAERVRAYERVRFLTNLDDPGQWCGLLVVDVQGVDPVKLADWLLERHRIIVTPIVHPEFQGIRVTPNVYTRLSEIDYFADVLERVVRGQVPGVAAH